MLSVARPDRPFTADERERFAELARHAAVSLENVARHERLARQATTDELTGLLNHRRMHEVLDAGDRAARRGSARRVALVMLDIDDFKRVNDTYGHQRGDEVLYDGRARRRVGRAARATTWRATAARSSRSCCPTPTSRRRGAWPSGSASGSRASRSQLPDGSSVRPTASLGVAVLVGQRRTSRS